MKKILYPLSLFLLAGTGAYAQPVAGPGASASWLVGGNTAVNTRNVIGTWWAPAAGIAPSQMWFTTGAAAPQYRMTIFGGGVSDFDGYIGMGNNLPAGFVPASRLHLHQTGANPNFTRYTNGVTGTTASDGLTIGIRSAVALYINHEQNQPHAFYTNDGSATGGNFERMRINALNLNGFIGMGNSGSFNALSQLHINLIGGNISGAANFGEVFRTEGLSTVDNSWRLFTGPAMASSTQKGRVFTSNTGTPHVHAIDQNFNLEATQADMVFWANGTRALGTLPAVERMRITSALFAGTDVTRVSISRDATAIVGDPRAMLHVGQTFNIPNSRGHRQWMDVGTFYNTGADVTYIGQQNIAANQNNTILSFGSDPVTFNSPAAPGDRMIFRFINDPGFGNLASGGNGLEIARMVSDGNNGRMSVGNPLGALIDPGNTLEIISSPGSPRPAGLRFRNLNCFSPTSPLCNPASPVYLSVDNNGDVILVNAPASGGGCCLGNTCGGPLNGLTSDYEIPMNNFNFTFSDPGTPLNDGQNFVQIGNNCGTPRAKLDVGRNFTNNSSSTIIGAYLENRDVALSSPFSGTAYGTYSVANNQNASNYGLYGEAMNASGNTAINGMAQSPYTGGSDNFNNTGVSGFAQEALSNFGVVGAAVTSNPLSQNNYAGLFRASAGGAANMNGNYGIYTAAGNSTNSPGADNVGLLSYASNGGNVNNNVAVAGISQNFGGAANDIGVYGEGAIGGYFTGGFVTAGVPIVFSDQQIKTNVKKVENGLDLLKQLNPVTYDYKTSEYPELHLSDKMQYGFIAQEVEAIIPELVTKTTKPEFKDEKGKVISKGGEFKGLAYDGLIPVLTQAIKEQQEIIEQQEETNKALNERLDKLEECINRLNLCSTPAGSNMNNNGDTKATKVGLTNAPSIVLDQNVPNPFAEQTVISYVLPQEVTKAQMLFYNAEGRLINSVDLNERGQCQLNVFASDLSNGIYTYTLVADGKIIDSKRMIRNK